MKLVRKVGETTGTITTEMVVSMVLKETTTAEAVVVAEAVEVVVATPSNKEMTF